MVMSFMRAAVLFFFISFFFYSFKERKKGAASRCKCMPLSKIKKEEEKVKAGQL